MMLKLNPKAIASILICSTVVVFGQLSLASNFSSPSPIIKFQEVREDRVFRGAAPEQGGVAWLAKNHFKTIIDLRIESPMKMYEEYKAATSLGIKYISVPMNPAGLPKDADINLIENSLLQNESLLPVFVHCTFGEDRTGLVMALYRVFTQRVKPQDAYQEMVNFGFHTWLINISHYFFEKTGYYPPMDFTVTIGR